MVSVSGEGAHRTGRVVRCCHFHVQVLCIQSASFLGGHFPRQARRPKSVQISRKRERMPIGINCPDKLPRSPRKAERGREGERGGEKERAPLMRVIAGHNVTALTTSISQGLMNGRTVQSLNQTIEIIAQPCTPCLYRPKGHTLSVVKISRSQRDLVRSSRRDRFNVRESRPSREKTAASSYSRAQGQPRE